MSEMKRRIMLVDGSEATRKMVSALLERQIGDVQVTGYDNAREALASLKIQRYDLIASALVLPDMDGLEFVRKIRRLGNHTATPIIVVSGDAATREDLQHGYEKGVTGFFDKSQGLQQLVDYIETFLPKVTGASGRVLYIEDSLTAATVLKQLMQKHGLQVVHVTSAEEALDLIREVGAEGPGSFDIIVSDVFLKGEMTGPDLIRAVRNDLNYTREMMPALLITVDGQEEEEYAKLLACGANDYVTKPVTEPIFIARLNSLLMIKHQYLLLTQTGTYEIPFQPI
ncbi:MAG: response regulator [Gammaproteobacteria bacterium]|nr:MAG: response regulator [Gammaproteobacteria bacterium]